MHIHEATPDEQTGIACRSLFDLGLHQDSSNPGKANRSSSTDASSRHLVFLTSFVYDQLWSLYLGRPSSISLGYLLTARRAAKEVAVPEVLDAWVSLSAQIAKVTEFLNSSTWTDAMAYDRRLSELVTELDIFFESLPSQMRYEEGTPLDLDARAYGLNIQLCGLRIVLHRLSGRLRHDRRDGLVDTGAQHLEDEACRQSNQTQSVWVVHRNAVQVAKLVRTFKQIYGVEKIITIMLDNIFIAATALISHTLFPPSTSIDAETGCEKDIQWLRCLSKTLEEVQKYYPVTVRMISTLSRLVEGTVLGGIFRARRGSAASNSSRIAVITSPTDGAGAWGSMEAFMHDFTFNIGHVMEPPFVAGDHRYSQDPVINAAPWSIGLSR